MKTFWISAAVYTAISGLTLLFTPPVVHCVALLAAYAILLVVYRRVVYRAILPPPVPSSRREHNPALWWRYTSLVSAAAMLSLVGLRALFAVAFNEPFAVWRAIGSGTDMAVILLLLNMWFLLRRRRMSGPAQAQ